MFCLNENALKFKWPFKKKINSFKFIQKKKILIYYQGGGGGNGCGGGGCGKF